MSNPEEDHREYPVTEAEYEDARCFIHQLAQLKLHMAGIAVNFAKQYRVYTTSGSLQEAKECLDQALDEFLHHGIKNAEHAIENYDDGVVADARKYYNSQRL